MVAEPEPELCLPLQFLIYKLVLSTKTRSADKEQLECEMSPERNVKKYADILAISYLLFNFDSTE